MHRQPVLVMHFDWTLAGQFGLAVFQFPNPFELVYFPLFVFVGCGICYVKISTKLPIVKKFIKKGSIGKNVLYSSLSFGKFITMR